MIVSLKTSGHDKIQKNAKTNDFTHVYGTQNAEVPVEPLHANKPAQAHHKSWDQNSQKTFNLEIEYETAEKLKFKEKQ
jgi:hypothetical protein